MVHRGCLDELRAHGNTHCRRCGKRYGGQPVGAVDRLLLARLTLLASFALAFFVGYQSALTRSTQRKIRQALADAAADGRRR